MLSSAGLIHQWETLGEFHGVHKSSPCICPCFWVPLSNSWQSVHIHQSGSAQRHSVDKRTAVSSPLRCFLGTEGSSDPNFCHKLSSQWLFRLKEVIVTLYAHYVALSCREQKKKSVCTASNTWADRDRDDHYRPADLPSWLWRWWSPLWFQALWC